MKSPNGIFIAALIAAGCGNAYAEDPVFITNHAVEDVCRIMIAPARTEKWTNIIGNLNGCLPAGYNYASPWRKSWRRNEISDIRIVYRNEEGTVSYESVRLTPGMMINIRDSSVDVDNSFAVNWNSVPAVGSTAELALYMRNETGKLKKYIPVRYTGGFMAASIEAVDKTGVATVTEFQISKTGRETRVVYIPEYYPGARIVHAVKNNLQHLLQRDDLAILKAAEPIVEKALKQPTLLQKELYLHDAIVGMAKYRPVDFSEQSSDFLARERTAAGVLLDGKANCQGFTDAFYLLGSLAGLNVGYWTGETSENHAWNTVTIDGLTYFVDITVNQFGFIWNNVRYFSHIYFNSPREIMEVNRKWDKNYEAGLKIAEKTDGNYFYTTPEYEQTDGKKFGIYYSSAEEGLRAIAAQLKGERLHMANFMTPYDPKYAEVKSAAARIAEYIDSHSGGGADLNYKIQIKSDPEWKYMFFTVYR